MSQEHQQHQKILMIHLILKNLKYHLILMILMIHLFLMYPMNQHYH